MNENRKFPNCVDTLYSKSGKAYHVMFHEGDQQAYLIGPLSSSGVNSANDKLYSTPAKSKQEAIEICKKELQKDKY
ncbi:MAG: hypothetical protein JXB48_04290 [Candidatus Latescibacteria bacterium]|nr:hypothetical protein [Candidatus Latescibacterota bacterium]